MKLIAIVVLLLSTVVYAKEMKLSCKSAFNMETVFENEVTLGSEKLNVGEFENFIFYVSQKADGRIELQAFDMEAPARNYATASLKEAGDYVELSIWNRNFVMDTRCTLIK